MLEIKEVKALIQRSQLDAKLGADCVNEWNYLVTQISDVPTYYLEHLVNYQSTVFQFLSDRLIDISLVLYSDKKVCGVWPLFLDLNNPEPVKSINDQFGGIVVPPLFIENFPKKSERRVIKSCISFVNNLLELANGNVW